MCVCVHARAHRYEIISIKNLFFKNITNKVQKSRDEYGTFTGL